MLALGVPFRGLKTPNRTDFQAIVAVNRYAIAMKIQLLPFAGFNKPSIPAGLQMEYEGKSS
jgi:hypothetical protein